MKKNKVLYIDHDRFNENGLYVSTFHVASELEEVGEFTQSIADKLNADSFYHGPNCCGIINPNQKDIVPIEISDKKVPDVFGEKQINVYKITIKGPDRFGSFDQSIIDCIKELHREYLANLPGY